MVTPWDLMVEPWVSEWNNVLCDVSAITRLPVGLVGWTSVVGILLFLVGLYEWLTEVKENEDEKGLSHLYNVYEEREE